MDEPEVLKEEETMSYIGMQLKKTKEGFEMSQEEYLESVEVEESKLKGGKIRPDLLDPPTEEEIKEEYVPLMQKIMGVTGWAARTQPDISFLFGELSRWSTKPSAEKVEGGLRLLNHAKQRKTSLVFTAVKDPKMVVFYDGSYSLQKCEGQ
uniref:Uncharacterized protein n=1 Tax=Chromera velia CCMP2878 TaxID=1169474 RepID=A0A0G4HT09_9ALVE|eukprot:Cvel_8359.t1-p1 / transcript=Cvel_8359.t1 / gene=Cvel_8359 / organism=Chromera_velia_CCMP2878 / gene_product=hypothetical protein / transcript_product=hypothetical protein / location=Cvel_scaffold460:71442-71891(-) / protein_length=150 / sequence_SO=supercontig / SO=protein_coding / is_pseudo=false